MPERQSQQAGTHMPLSSLPGGDQAGSESPPDDKLGELPSCETGHPALDIPAHAHSTLKCQLKVVQLNPLVSPRDVCRWEEPPTGTYKITYFIYEDEARKHLEESI